ncbi:hypothetical protein [Streptomyces sp. NRRL F-5135]|uniref:hypothetical protein n=1 Tax=Streptomyces sp. NRRL F-5135 TaxID=1463858 RepID=UPI0004CA07EF|nr:hypothetical protein [Streptomyces sp. NRRL F-5135]
MISRPEYTDPIVESVTLKVVAGPDLQGIDGPQIHIALGDEMSRVLTDDDVNDIAGVIANRLATTYPAYYVAVEQLWQTYRRATVQDVAHRP